MTHAQAIKELKEIEENIDTGKEAIQHAIDTIEGVMRVEKFLQDYTSCEYIKRKVK